MDACRAERLHDQRKLHLRPGRQPLSSLAAATWSYNASNQLTAISGSPGTTHTYDNNGNTLTKTDGSVTTTYAWDVENRLTSVTLPGSGGTITFKYDPLGRRIYKSSSTGTTIFAYDGESLIEETNASGSALARYSQGEDLDEPLALLRNGTTHYYQVDGLGSVTSLTDSAGALATTYVYDSFGKLLSSTGSAANTFRFTGREYDAETTQYFYRERYADPSQGRFLSEDPIRFSAGVNFFSYVSNNPINLIDPLGLCEVSPKMEECLERLFGKSIDSIKYQLKKKKRNRIAETRKNKIILYIPCDQFFADTETVLEEYYHVLEQWNTGRMGRLSYLLESFKKVIGPGDPYEDNKYEKEAKDFARKHTKELEDCLKCGNPQ